MGIISESNSGTTHYLCSIRTWIITEFICPQLRFTSGSCWISSHSGVWILATGSVRICVILFEVWPSDLPTLSSALYMEMNLQNTWQLQLLEQQHLPGKTHEWHSKPAQATFVLSTAFYMTLYQSLSEFVHIQWNIQLDLQSTGADETTWETWTNSPGSLMTDGAGGKTISARGHQLCNMLLDAIHQSLNLLTFRSHCMGHLFSLTFPGK